MLDVRSLSKSPKVAMNYLKNTSKSLNKGDWCFNKGANQARVVLNNKVLMSPTWARPIGYQWGWSRMIKHIWLTKLQNFKRVPSNLSSRLIHGSFGWGYVIKTHPKEVDVWLVCKWTTNSWKCLIFMFKIPKDNNNFFHACKHDYEHYEKWHQQKMGNPQP